MLLSRLCALIALASILLFTPLVSSAAEVFAARYPALSPDGETVVFSYWGDLWTAPVDGSANATRLTVHLAFESNPRFSPDGTEVAFNSTRSGNTDIWVIPAVGGTARQVTTFSGTDTLCGWSPDGERIVFNSSRDLWSSDIYHVDSYGETSPVRVTFKDHDTSAEAVMLEDGSFVYARGGGRWWRKGYHGTRQHDIWLLDTDSHATQLTDYDGYDHWPMVSSTGQTIFYVSDSDGIANIWAMDMDGGNKRQLTSHGADGVQFPTIKPGGDTIVYEQQGWLWTISAGGGTPEKLSINIESESKDNWTEKRTFNNDASDYAVSAHAKYALVTVEGDLWATKDPDGYKKDAKPDQDLSVALRLTASDDAREIHPTASPNNTLFAYCSDADGDYDVYLYDLQAMESRKLTDTDWDDLSPKWDPSDENRLFYLSGNRKLVVHDLETDEVQTVVESDMRRGTGRGSFDISPDGEWVAWSDGIAYGQSEVFIKDTRGEHDPVNISRHHQGDSSPLWSPDGKRILYSGSRDSGRHLYVIDLVEEADSFDLEFLFAADRPEDEAEAEDEEQDGDGEDSEESADEEEADEKEDEEEIDGPLEIDFDDIHLRARRISSNEYSGNAIFSGDGEWIIYETRPAGKGTERWTVKADGSGNKYFMGGGWSSPQLADDGKKIFYRDGGTVRYVKFSGGSNKGSGSISAKGEFWLNKRARWHQMYREAWRGMREQFYDPGMHGANWDAIYEQYLPYVDAIGTPEEFSLMFQEVLGELNGSHMGITMRERSYSTTGHSTGHLGLEFDPGFSGPGLLVSHVTYRGPADQPGVEIAKGDVVLAIDDTPVDYAMRWLDLLDDKSGDPVLLEVDGDEGSREVIIKATSHGGYQGLLYREWEIANEDYISAKSDGRIGYIHIRSMSGGELAKFEREFIAENIDKDAIIVDVRFNGGGLIHEQLFDLLDRHHFGYSAKRDQPLTIQPAHAFDKPTALLINARSASDAEIFPSGWRHLGLGPVVGVDTYGAVIGTGSYRLIDGSSIRMPLYGWYDSNMRNLELSGTPPDHYLAVHPDDLRKGVDVQLDKALELMLAELE